MALNLIITENDVLSAKKLLENESVNPLTSNKMFRSAVYTMLSAREKYTRQMVMYEKLLQNGFCTPEAILDRSDDASRLVKGLKKDAFLIKLAEWWIKSSIYETISGDIARNNRAEEFNVRNMIAEDTAASGLSYKGASLFLNSCGYENIVALDAWTLRALVAENYAIKHYYYVPKNGKKNFTHTYLGNGIYLDHGINSKRPYCLYEEYFRDLTHKCNQKFGCDFSPLIFRNILWTKRSAWGEKFGNDPNQMVIDFK